MGGDVAQTMGKRWRRLRMGVSTLLGRRQGFFIPYRYAAGVESPAGYPEIEALFRDAEPRFREALAAIEAHGDDLGRIGEDAEPPAPRWGQQWFPGLDAAALYAIIRSRAPNRMIEVGSGHSTRFAARAIADGGLGTRLTCIDPAPRATLEALDVEWRRRLLSADDLPLFAALEAGDVAFFDSSHILTPGTDVDLILNRILPSLQPGVLVHIHDIFLPDGYPPAWEWRGYNEQNAIAPLLIGGGFAAIFANRYARTRLGVVAHRPAGGAPESSLWLERERRLGLTPSIG